MPSEGNRGLNNFRSDRPDPDPGDTVSVVGAMLTASDRSPIGAALLARGRQRDRHPSTGGSGHRMDTTPEQDHALRALIERIEADLHALIVLAERQAVLLERIAAKLS